MPNQEFQNIDFKKSHTPKGVPIPENAFGRIVFKDKPTDFCICRIADCGQVISFANRSKTGLYHHIDQHNKTNRTIQGSNKRPRTSSILTNLG